MYDIMDVLINLGIISQCIHISHHHIVHFKYIKILLVNYTSMKLGEINYLRIKNYRIQEIPGGPTVKNTPSKARGWELRPDVPQGN